MGTPPAALGLRAAGGLAAVFAHQREPPAAFP